MTDIAAFPSIRNVLYAGNNLQKVTATTAVKAGQVVAINATGVSMAVDPDVAAAGSWPIGVALFDAAAGASVTIAMDGCIVYVANADDTTGIDAGDLLEGNDNTVGGTVNAAAISANGATVTLHYVIGQALDDIAGAGTGKMMIRPQLIGQPNAS